MNYQTTLTRLLAICLLLWLGPWEMAAPQVPPSSTLQTEKQQGSAFTQIEADFSKNLITLDEWARYSIYSVFDPQRLPAPYSELPSTSLSTYLTTKIFQVWDRLDVSTQNLLQKYGFTPTGALSPPNDLPLSSESTHFVFHYSITPGDTNAIDSTDTDANGIPDYVDQMKAIFEHVYTFIVDSMKYTAPPSDSGTIGNNAKYDVFLRKLDADTYGYATPHQKVEDNPSSSNVTEKNAATSYIVMNNQYQAEGIYTAWQIIKVTAAHEFFHAIQMGYDVYEKAWLMEATATWIEDEIYDEINQNIIYLENWFRFPHYPLDATASEVENRWYGSWIFFRYLSEHLGGRQTVRKIWEKSINYNSKIKDYSFSALNDALAEVNSSFKSAFRDFTIANLIQTIKPYNYKEAERYPNIAIARILFQTKSGMKYSSPRRGARYFQIRPNVISGPQDDIKFTVTPKHPNLDIDLLVVTRKGTTVNKFMGADSGGALHFNLKNSSNYDAIYAILINLDTVKTDLTFDVEFKSSLIQLSAKSQSGQLASGYYLLKEFKDRTDAQGEIQTDLVIRHYFLSGGYGYEFILPHVNAGEVYLAQNNGDVFVIAENYNDYRTHLYGINNGLLQYLASDFYNIDVAAVDQNKVVFYGSLFVPSIQKGIFMSNLTSGPPTLILDMTDTDDEIDQIVGENDTFVALKNNPNVPDSQEFLALTSGTIQSLYAPDSGMRIQSLDYDDGLLAWSEIDGAYLQRSIKAYDFNQGKFIEIRSNDGIDPYSVATAAGRVVWWENTGAATKIQLWENDSIKTIRATFNGLYLNNSGAGLHSLQVPMDQHGIAWMETNFILYYYHFATGSLNRYDLTNYFTDRAMVSYFVKVSGSHVVIEALSSTQQEDVGIYLFELGDPITGLQPENDLDRQIPTQFRLSQNYPNPFNPGTTFSYELPTSEHVSLIIYDITGRRVKTLVNQKQAPGTHTVFWDGTNDGGQRLASGVYFYRLKAGNFLQSRRMVLLR
ncbi:MAG: FlgD immunoglobulin-like domain containing protein [candidate division KSB1 bacterium]|nr:FlgD immunoglobulin-like domain containing protein [candidate division KSB1 bacterium]